MHGRCDFKMLQPTRVDVMVIVKMSKTLALHWVILKFFFRVFVRGHYSCIAVKVVPGAVKDKVVDAVANVLTITT